MKTRISVLGLLAANLLLFSVAGGVYGRAYYGAGLFARGATVERV